MKKYENARIEVSEFNLMDVVMASPAGRDDWYGDQPTDNLDNNPVETGAGDIWSDMFGPNP